MRTTKEIRRRTKWATHAYGLMMGAAILVSAQFLPVMAQQVEHKQDSANDSPRMNQQTGRSELEKENLGYVAASFAQIQTVLLKDPGLMVELKRYVAKETADNGQVVQVEDLTDQGILDRLNRDVKFRSVTTRLLQRYGYLMPSLNPESTMAREQSLILQERARRIVQIGSPEDSEMTPRSKDDLTEMERTAVCEESRGSPRCGPSQNSGRQRNASAPGGDSRQPPTSQREQREQQDTQPQQRGAQMIQTAGIGPDLGTNPGTTMRRTNPDLYLSPGGQDGESASDGTMPRGSTGLRPGAPQNFGSSVASSISPMGTPSSKGDSFLPRRNRGWSENEAGRENEFPPVTMVHKANPFSDVPSLYEMYVQATPQRKPERFGLDVFRNDSRLTDAVPMDLPVGPEYVVGPGDGLAVDIWGGVSQRLTRVVDREGRINLPEAGPLLVSGKTLGEVQLAVQQLLRTEFRDVSADVSLARLRTVRIYVVGDVKDPGAYDISSLSTPLNAIYAAGGVTERGSLRSLKHFRGKKLVQEVDAYDLLLHGVQTDLKHLENGDTLMVPPLGPEVTVDGMVRRPANYELNGEKNLAETVELAGGILASGTLNHIEVQRIEAHVKRTMLSFDVAPTDNKEAIEAKLKEFQIVDGDEVHVFPIAPYNEDAIFLQGHVIRPGKYSYTKGMKLTDLVSSYKDLLPEPAGHYAEIIRINQPDNHPTVESFDLAAALEHPEAAPKLQPLDTLRIFGRYDFEAAPAIWVGGEVRQPGKYDTSGQVHLRDGIYLAGGLTPDAAQGSAQVFRSQSDGTLKILSVNVKEAIEGNPIDNILLLPRDRLLIHKSPARVDPATVNINGEVAKPGRYPLTTNMHVEDLIRVAGGLKRAAYTGSADLTRYPATQGAGVAVEHVAVNLPEALSGEVAANLVLHEGDVLTIQPIPGWNDIAASVTVRGEVEHPGTYGIKPGERLSSVLQRTGGFSAEASPYGAVLMRREVRELELKAHLELIERMKAEEAQLKALPEGDADQKNTKMNAIARTETTLKQLQASEPIGRVVVHVPADMKDWKNGAADVAMREGDVLIIPKKANYVMVNGQVFNPTAVSFLPGRSAKWYLSQAGGFTSAADKKAVFVIRANGSVISAKNNGGEWWAGDPLGAALKPGDTVIVPEKAPKVGGPNWVTIMQAAQMASSIALAVAYIHP